MKVLFLTRSTLHEVFGGDTVQILSTAKYLRKLGVEVDVRLSNETIDYSDYDLLHSFNVIRPADTLRHAIDSKLPLALSTIFVDFSEFEKKQRRGIQGIATKLFSDNQIEYLKAVLRQIKNQEKIQSVDYFLKGHKRSVKQLAQLATYLLPNSQSEINRFFKKYGIEKPYEIVYNGIDTETFPALKTSVARDPKLILCVARIEGNKNQLNLIKAVNGTDFRLILIGNHAPNHKAYYDECRRIAGENISFDGFIPQEKLFKYYQEAKVHVLPSWSETCGLSSLEAAYYGCNIVITDKGDTKEYYGENAFYCDPGNPDSILLAIKNAAEKPVDNLLKKQIDEVYNWEQAAKKTLEVYHKILKTKRK